MSFYIYLGIPFDVSIMPLIAPLAWAPHCCLQLYLGVKQRSCETPIVFICFPIIITILPLESMAGKKSGVIWCRGGALINKIAFLLISLLIQKSPFRREMSKNAILLIIAPPRKPIDTRFFYCTWERASKHAITFYFDKSKRFGHKPRWRKIYPDAK